MSAYQSAIDSAGRNSRLKVLLIASAIGLTWALGGAVSASAAGKTPVKKGGFESSAAAEIAPQTTAKSKKFCISGFDYATNIIEPTILRDIFVNMKKSCAGSVVVRFSAELLPHAVVGGAYIDAQLRATCLGTGGFAGGCLPGEVYFGAPGYTYLFRETDEESDEYDWSSHTSQWVFPWLAPGRWKIEVELYGDGGSWLGYRTLTVDAYKGG